MAHPKPQPLAIVDRLSPDRPAPSYWTYVPALTLIRGFGSAFALSSYATMFKSLGLDNRLIGYLTLFTIPALLKFIWAPFADMYRTKRWWTLSSEFFFGVSLLVLSIGLADSRLSLTTLVWLYAGVPVGYAVGEFACDGFFTYAVSAGDRTSAVAALTVFARIASLMVSGLIFLAGSVSERTGSLRAGWACAMAVFGLFVSLLALYNYFLFPTPPADQPARARNGLAAWRRALQSYVQLPGIGVAIAFLCLFRFGECIVLLMASVFFLDSRAAGGLNLQLEQISIINTFGIFALLVGGALAGVIMKRYPVRRAMLGLSLAMIFPNILYCMLATFPCYGGFQIAGLPQIPQIAVVIAVQSVESFGYGLGFTFFFCVIVGLAHGEYRASHMAIGNALGLLGYIIPNAIGGIHPGAFRLDGNVSRLGRPESSRLAAPPLAAPH